MKINRLSLYKDKLRLEEDGSTILKLARSGYFRDHPSRAREDLEFVKLLESIGVMPNALREEVTVLVKSRLQPGDAFLHEIIEERVESQKNEIIQSRGMPGITYLPTGLGSLGFSRKNARIKIAGDLRKKLSRVIDLCWAEIEAAESTA